MKQNWLMWIVGIVLFTLTLIFLLGGFDSVHHDWNENYQKKNNEPYGNSVLSDLLVDYFEDYPLITLDKSPNNKTLPAQKSGHRIYLFTGKQQYLNPSEATTVLNFVENGNTALLITENPSWIIQKAFNPIDSDSTYALLYRFSESTVKVNFSDPLIQQKQPYSFHYQNGTSKSFYDYASLNPDLLEANQAISPLGYFSNNQVNFVALRYGNGIIYLHTNPLFFSNYHLIRKDAARYASSVLSYLKPGTIIWDTYATRWKPGSDEPENPDERNNSPLSFILKNKSLRTALYILLLAAGVYMLFSLKRIQRVVPVIEPLRNSSLEFIQTIARLYFNERQHPTMIRHQMRYLFSFIRERYRIQLTELNPETIEKIHLRSGVSKDILNDIQQEFLRLRVYTELSDQDALKFHQHLNRFYSTCK